MKEETNKESILGLVPPKFNKLCKGQTENITGKLQVDPLKNFKLSCTLLK